MDSLRATDTQVYYQQGKIALLYIYDGSGENNMAKWRFLPNHSPSYILQPLFYCLRVQHRTRKESILTRHFATCGSLPAKVIRRIRHLWSSIWNMALTICSEYWPVSICLFWTRCMAVSMSMSRNLERKKMTAEISQKTLNPALNNQIQNERKHWELVKLN